jgi:hypothetical protein
MSLFLWSFQSQGGELFALSTGRIPPAEDHLLKDWKKLKGSVEHSKLAISKITYEQPELVLNNVKNHGYHTLEPKLLREDWKRPSDA